MRFVFAACTVSLLETPVLTFPLSTRMPSRRLSEPAFHLSSNRKRNHEKTRLHQTLIPAQEIPLHLCLGGSGDRPVGPLLHRPAGRAPASKRPAPACKRLPVTWARRCAPTAAPCPLVPPSPRLQRARAARRQARPRAIFQPAAISSRPVSRPWSRPGRRTGRCATTPLRSCTRAKARRPSMWRKSSTVLW